MSKIILCSSLFNINLIIELLMLNLKPNKENKIIDNKLSDKIKIEYIKIIECFKYKKEAKKVIIKNI
ncbi:MAG: hypothetical protein GX275_04925 [Clostridiales bacterium]|nr:hypothetical protein [Clostridiales bacterium]